MANIENIKILRERTGAGMMDCKHALDATDNNVDKACDWLREKGIAKVAKKSDRIAAEGLTFIKVCDKCGKAIITELNCETDFVAKSDPFKKLCEDVTTEVLHNGYTDVKEIQDKTATLFTDATVKLGEKLTFRRFETITKTPEQCFGTYLHMGGKIGVIVLLSKDDSELAKGIAMSIAANNPKYCKESDIPASDIEKETVIQTEVCKNDEKLKNKPEAALQNIVKGKVHKVLSESVLEDQYFVLEPEKSVGQVLKEKGNSIIKFVRYQVGEGLEKRVDNFAEEVAEQAK
ncbi:MAG: translation elongation factor Ts [Bacilli bacterium]